MRGQPVDDVFLSYSHDSEDHKARVLALAVDLISKGIRAGLDQYHPFPSEGWPAWMGRRIGKARFVLVVCTKPYHDRAMGVEEPGYGRGATWESQVITQELYDNAGSNKKFIPIVCDEASREFVPNFLRPYTTFNISVEKDYVSLLRLLTDQPEHIPPPLGQRIVLPPQTGAPTLNVYKRPTTDLMKVDERNAKGPMAFISYSRVDSDAAQALDRLLRARGIGVWLDTRELLPGRNLVDEIFDRGISKSDAVVVLLSKSSVKSEWVRLELTNAIVQTVRGVAKAVIPVLLDDVEVPEYLRQFVWERVGEDGFARSADRIVAAITGGQSAPVASLPAYAGVPVHGLPGLTAEDERILAEACRLVLAAATYNPVVGFGELFSYGQETGMTADQVEESLAVLEQGGYFTQVIHGLGSRYPSAGLISYFGMENYLVHYLPTEYRRAKVAIVSAIVNENARSSMMIALSLKLHPAIVEHVLEGLEDSGYVMASHHMQGISVHPNPTLPRLLRKLERE